MNTSRAPKAGAVRSAVSGLERDELEAGKYAQGTGLAATLGQLVERTAAKTLEQSTHGLVMLLTPAIMLGVALTAPAAAADTPLSAAAHDVHCVRASGHLYLGSAGAVRPRRTVTCAISFYQLSPDADGVIVVLRTARHHSSYSVVLEHLATPPAGRTLIAWLHHPGPAELHCALINGHLYLGSAGASGTRRTVTCTVRFYQLIPHADGVIVALRTPRHHNAHSIAIKHLPLPPTGRTLLRWVA